MKLANSNGGNKGKKYIRLTGDEEITPDRVKEVLRFTNWFNDNCGSVHTSIATKTDIDPEVFASTYIRMYEAIAFKGLNTKNYKAYFCRAYYTNKMLLDSRETKRDSRHYDISGTWDLGESRDLQDVPVQERDSAEMEQYSREIFDYVRRNFTKRDACIFGFYVRGYNNPPTGYLSRRFGVTEEYIEDTVEVIRRIVNLVFSKDLDRFNV